MNCDIIMPVWNEPEVTRKCIDSIYANTNTPFSLIIINNASQSPTRLYLEKLKTEIKNVILIHNEENLGFVKATNQGLKIATSDYICLLNNDTIVTKGWLENIIKVMDLFADIGIANPKSNDLGHKLNGLTAAQYAEIIKNDLTYIEVDYCKGFCMVIKKEVLDAVGLLDENFGRGGFEETDFCRRACQKGYMRVRVDNAYVHHLSKTSFRRLKKKELDDLFVKNRDYYYQKWGMPQRYAYVLFDKTIKKITGQDMLRLARDWHHVYLMMASSAQYKPEVTHDNIKIFRYPGLLFAILALFKILHRKKKKFAAIVTDRQWFAKLITKVTPKQYFDITTL